jgi:uncharacterized protein (DUF1697 family)
MTYVALLRGINVGGNSKVSMADLKDVFSQAGMVNVTTYINSGNVIFDCKASPASRLAGKLERAIENCVGFNVKVIVITKQTLLSLYKALPPSWSNDHSMKCDVMFLWENVDSPDIIEQLPIRPELDNVIYKPGALFWSIDRKDATRSGMYKLVGTPLYKQMTVRNCNTLRKLAAMLDARAE